LEYYIVNLKYYFHYIIGACLDNILTVMEASYSGEMMWDFISDIGSHLVSTNIGELNDALGFQWKHC